MIDSDDAYPADPTRGTSAPVVPESPAAALVLGGSAVALLVALRRSTPRRAGAAAPS